MDPNETYRFLPAEGERLVIMREDGEVVFGNHAFPDQIVALAALLDMAKSHDLEAVVQYRDDGRVEQVVLGREIVARTGAPPVTFPTSLPLAVFGTLGELADELGVSRDEILRRAVNFYRIASDAEAEGNRLAILTSDDEIVRDVTGFRPRHLEPVAGR